MAFEQKIALAKLLFSSGETDEALAVLRAVLDDEPFNFEARIWRDLMLPSKREPSDFISTADLPPDLDERRVAAIRFERLGMRESNTFLKPESAISYFTKAIEADPSYPTPYLRRSSQYGSLKLFDAEVADMSKYLELEPGDSSVYFFRSNRHLRDGRYAEALEDCRQVLALNPEHGVVMLIASTASWKLCDKAMAQEYAEKALQAILADDDEESLPDAHRQLVAISQGQDSLLYNPYMTSG